MGEPRPRWTLAVALLLTAGCTTDGGRDNRRDDPLLGLGSRSGTQPVAVATAGGGVQGPSPPAYKPQPPLTPAVPTSTAALAGGFQPLPGGTDLRMGAATPVPPPTVADPRSGAPAQPTALVTPV